LPAVMFLSLSFHFLSTIPYSIFALRCLHVRCYQSDTDYIPTTCIERSCTRAVIFSFPLLSSQQYEVYSSD
jgi:hypothetical protein